MNKTSQVKGLSWEEKLARRGRLAWIIWSVAMLAQILNTFHRVAAGPAVDRIMADLGVTAATWGALMSMYFYIYAMVQFPAGIMADSLGPRKTIAAGCIISTVGSCIFGLAPSIEILFLGRIVLSLGVSLVYVNLLKLVIDWFKSRHFARMVGINSMLITLGSLIGTTPMALLISGVGWRWSFEILSIINLAVCILCWVIIRNKPSEVGLPPPDAAQEDSPIKESQLNSKGQIKGELRQNIRYVLTSRHIWLTFLIGMGLYGTNLVFLAAWGIPYLMQVYGMSREGSANVMLFMLVAHLITLPVLTYISDRFSLIKIPIFTCTLVNLAALLALVFWNGGQPPLAVAFLVFILSGTCLSAWPFAYVLVRENMPPSMSGLAMGMINVSPFISAAIFQMLVGFVLDANWQGVIIEGVRQYPVSAYQSGFMLVLLPAAAAVIGAVLLKYYRRN
ncbi:MAG TPA: MFS transporter [Dehalococcoidia bacterium]|nr:MFS transporter [Dehalococcoidia bacterium]